LGDLVQFTVARAANRRRIFVLDSDFERRAFLYLPQQGIIGLAINVHETETEVFVLFQAQAAQFSCVAEKNGKQ
jgi:hypothetical protein